jgi:hypothetical protein
VRFGINSLACATAGVIALAAAGAASAATNLVNNPDFTSNTVTGGYTGGQVGYNATIQNWTVPYSGGKNNTSSYVFVFNAQSGTSGTDADHVGTVNGQDGLLNLWGPADGGTYSGSMLDPNISNNGSFIASDPSYQNGAISQAISGLTVGTTYTVSFDYAAAEQYAHTGDTTEGWQVSIDGDTQDSVDKANASKGFNGWFTDSFTFTYDGGSDVLSFLATGTGTAAQPPFALLDDVSVEAVTGGVPEPATWAMMLLGIGGLGGALRMRRRQLFAAA